MSAAALATALLLAFVSCGGGDEPDYVKPQVSLAVNPVTSAAGEQFIDVTAGSDWEISFAYEGSQTGWASLSSYTGTGNVGGLTLKYTANPATDSRYVTITVTSKGGSGSVQFRQYGTSEPETPIPGGYGEDVTSKAWLELPATVEGDGCEFFYHLMNGGKDRNYSFYYSYDNFVSWWVAYPLNVGLIGSSIGGRTDAWGYDPLIPKDMQQYIVNEEGMGVSYGTGHSRGHQIPSADRYGTQANNAATFYATNMTPQDYNFNGGIWAGLEENVRSLARKADTLYVVTGCVPGSEFIVDRGGRRINVPAAYYKALLFYSGSGAAYTFQRFDGYAGIAVYMEHRSTLSGTSAQYAMSIKELEEKTGIEFFAALPSVVGNETAGKIKAQGPVNTSTSVWPPSDWWTK